MPAKRARVAGERQRRAMQRRRGRRRDPEAGQPQRVLGQVQDRLQAVLVDLVEVRGRRPEKPAPGAPVLAQPRRRLLDRADHRRGAAVVERVRQVDLRPAPLEPVLLQLQRAQEGRCRRHRLPRRADVVDDSRDRQFRAAGAAADRLGRLQHRHLDARLGQRHRAGEPVGARADDRCRAHAGAAARLAGSSRRSTSTGNSHDSSSQGWRSTMSATATEPSSTSPVAAS